MRTILSLLRPLLSSGTPKGRGEGRTYIKVITHTVMIYGNTHALSHVCSIIFPSKLNSIFRQCVADSLHTQSHQQPGSKKEFDGERTFPPSLLGMLSHELP
jgi:hypothetical protein